MKDRALELLAGEMFEMVSLGWTDEEAKADKEAFFDRLGDYTDGLTDEEVWQTWANVVSEDLIRVRTEELYDWIGHDHDSIENDLKHDYLTENQGRDGQWYLWYMDEVDNAAIRISDGEIISLEEIEALFC